MELRSRTSVNTALILMLGLLMAAPFVAGAMPDGRTSTFRVPAVLEDLGFPFGGTGQEVSAEARVSARAGVSESGRAVAGQEPRASEPTDEFVRDLGAAHLLVSASGEAILSRTAGLGSARQLVLAQAAADRFGITNNPFFDPLRVAVIRDGDAIVDLSTGVIMGHEIGSAMFGTTEVIGTDLLEELRSTAGWTLTSAREAMAPHYRRTFGYVPAFLRSDEAYEAYIESARANYAAAT